MQQPWRRASATGARFGGVRYLVTTSVAETVLALMLGRSVKVLAVSVLALDLLVLIEESLLSVGVAEIAGTGRVTRDEARATRARGGEEEGVAAGETIVGVLEV